MAANTSFQKKSRSKLLQIPGTRPSLHNNQLLVSTGIPSLDAVVGGGLAVGTVLLVEEDTYSSYSKLMLKYFLAEGVMTGQSIFLSSADIAPKDLLQELPGPIQDDPEKDMISAKGNKEQKEDLQIAWRYQNLPQHQNNPSGIKFGHYYNLGKTMEPAAIERTEKYLVDLSEEQFSCSCPTEGELAMKPSYEKVLTEIQSSIEKGQFSTSATVKQRNILRLGIHSLGSPQWGEEGGHHFGSDDHSLPRFLYALRALMRTSFAVCLLTIPTHLFHDKAFVRRIEHLCDTVIQLDSFAGSDKETNPAFKEYHGLFNIMKLPRLNSLICHMPETLDLAFKLKRKKFMIEKLHLPPELSETASRNQEDPVPQMKPGMGCGTGKSKLDF